MPDKLILSNESVLHRKYASRGTAQILASVNHLISRDAARGIETFYLSIDSSAVQQFGGSRVTDPLDETQCKQVVDAVSHVLTPYYIMLLGSRDVIPHVSLPNLNYNGVRENDPDRVIPSDLPYACDAPVGSPLVDFTFPSRRVGRLPDITGGWNPGYLSYLLRVAAEATERPAAEYQRYFALCAAQWKSSTAAVLSDLFQDNGALATCPGRRPPWSHDELSALTHFINCHGEPGDATFYGRPGPLPEAFSGADIDGKLSNGTVATVECCYGAELYAPGERRSIPIANTYLRSQAYGYFGSTNTTFGGQTDVRDADVICRAFTKQVLEGESLGDAALRARAEYASQVDPLDPVRFKTLAQFVLLGDPSLRPVR